MMTKATLYLDSELYTALKLRAFESNQTVSKLMNEALQAQLAEDYEDITAIRTRLRRQETPLSYEAALHELQQSGKI